MLVESRVFPDGGLVTAATLLEPGQKLTGPGYDGHAFWDTETFVLPVLALTVPDAAASALRWRHYTLPRAIERAREHGLKGAMSRGGPSPASPARRTGRPAPDGEPLEILHYDEKVQLSAGKPEVRPIQAVPPRPRPASRLERNPPAAEPPRMAADRACPVPGARLNLPRMPALGLRAAKCALRSALCGCRNADCLGWHRQIPFVH